MSVGSVGTSSAYSYLQSLLQQQQSANGSSASDPVTQLLSAFYPSGSGQSAGSSGAPSSTGADSSAGAGCFGFSPDTMASLISIQGQQWHQAIDAQAQHVFGEFDADGDGAISKSEFENAFGSNADMSKVDGLFSALDTNGDGSISLDELTSAAEQSHAHQHHMHGAGQGGGGLADLLSSTDLTGATSQTATNADGSTSTTITYADGSTVTMTTPASSSSDASSSNANGNSSGNSLGNLLERLIQLQAQFLASVSSQTNISAPFELKLRFS